MLENAIESMSDGFVMFDAEDRLVICNSRYRELYAVSAPFITPGALFEDIIREGAKRGQYPQAGADIEAFVKDLTAWHRGDFPPMERLLPDGRWLLVTERRTRGRRHGRHPHRHHRAQGGADRDRRGARRGADGDRSQVALPRAYEPRTADPAQRRARPRPGPGRRPRRSRRRSGNARAPWKPPAATCVAVANDVLDLAKIEAGRFELRPAAVALPELLRECVDWVTGRRGEQADRAPHRHRAGPAACGGGGRDPPAPARAQLPVERGEVHPARRPGGAARHRRRRRPGRVPVRIEVSDDGPGVPEALRTEVFGDFVQLGDRPDGTGLGLAIAAHIAARMDGRIGCDANTAAPGGRGALFWTELPLEPAAGAAPAAPAAAPSEAAANVPPANPARRRRAQAGAAGAGRGRRAGQPRGAARAARIGRAHSVSCVGGGEEAVAALAASPDPPFDAVLMDVMMPGLDGREATKRIRALPGAAGRVPVLAVTAGAFPEDIAACHAAGMDAHLAKPIERNALLAALASLTAPRTGATPAGSAPGASPGVAEAALAALPLLARGVAALIVVPGLDRRASLALAGEFLEEIKAAAALLEEVPGGAGPALAQPAHRLAGAAATLGAERLAWAARRLQSAAAAKEAGDGDCGDLAAMRRDVLDTAAETVSALRAALAEPALV